MKVWWGAWKARREERERTETHKRKRQKTWYKKTVTKTMKRKANKWIYIYIYIYIYIHIHTYIHTYTEIKETRAEETPDYIHCKLPDDVSWGAWELNGANVSEIRDTFAFRGWLIVPELTNYVLFRYLITLMSSSIKHPSLNTCGITKHRFINRWNPSGILKTVWRNTKLCLNSTL